MKNLKKTSIILLILSFLTSFTSANAEIKVVASIKPIHSLASYLMDGVAEPDLIVDGYASPHGFAMKPSHAKMLQNADIVFWVGEDLENFLEKPLNSIATKAEKIEFMDLKGLVKLKFRERNIFDDHDDHDHDKHAKKDDHDDHDHDEHAKKEDGHDDHDDHDGHGGHNHGEFDPHIWLDPINAKVILFEMSKHLIENDPKNEVAYRANLSKAYKEIDKLTANVSSELTNSVASIVFHDAYQYFEKRFGLSVVGALTVNPDVMPGAEQLSEIREVIEEKKVKCIFSEPQFNPAIIKSIASDTGVKTGVLDPLGATINKSKNMYFNLIEDMSNALKDCS